MATSRLSIPADTEQVRVARLVAGSAARRAGVGEDDIEDVRLAVGEAVGVAVLKHVNAPSPAPVVVEFIEQDDSFAVLVRDEVPDEYVETMFARAVISGLVPDAVFDDEGTRMTWELAAW